MFSIGKNSYLCDPTVRGNANNISIGNYSCVGEGCTFDGGFGHEYKNVTSFPLNKIWTELPSNIVCKGDIIVGHDCWIGENSTIISGVTIGDGCVIGYGTIVTKSIEPYTVVTNKKSWKRFTEEQVEKLLEIQWWNWDDERVLKNAKLLLSQDIDNFINNYA